MSDAIFKGSSSSGRKAGNSAEATLVFDNSGNHLAVDALEVHVTRRVFRSGEGEYLINGQPCRLKDIKDLFRGTGIGVDAYTGLRIVDGKVLTGVFGWYTVAVLDAATYGAAADVGYVGEEAMISARSMLVHLLAPWDLDYYLVTR